MSTLIIGTRCTDGIVLAADRRGLRGYEPVEQCKILKVDIGAKAIKRSVLLAGAGVSAFWDEVAWSLAKSTQADGESGIQTLLDAVDRVSNLSINLSARYQRDGLDERLGCVVAGFDTIIGGKAELYYFAGAGFSKTEFICLGSGGSYALPMADLLLHQLPLSTYQAVEIMPFLFLIVERVNVSVGEGPDIFVVREGEGAVQVETNKISEARIRAGNLIETLPDSFLKNLNDLNTY